jgi:hypothetical protein
MQPSACPCRVEQRTCSPPPPSPFCPEWEAVFLFVLNKLPVTAEDIAGGCLGYSVFEPTAHCGLEPGIVLGVTVAVGVIAVGDTADGAWVLGRLRLAQ